MNQKNGTDPRPTHTHEIISFVPPYLPKSIFKGTERECIEKGRDLQTDFIVRPLHAR